MAAVAAGVLVLSSNRQPDQPRPDLARPDLARPDLARPDLAREAAGLTKAYGAGLLGALKGAMEGIGPVGAVGFCHDEAPGIATDLSQRSGWTVRRTSLKPRNPAAAPDDYERKVMEAFNAKIAAGAKAASLKQAEIVEQDGKRVFRFIQAIPTAELCLACHGSELKPEVAAKIKDLYPADQATGFKAGDMRGVFTLSKTL
ncbi:DUF3365 domain-containing protein [Blastochloris sulfoviridis]|uniref:DUF3365 domain-containing protein n=2 Tax=Blastochloris sulfoviridis TaxID=50712 RepID=A0A5M6I0Y1_9HYPH|nr:DUF3365 domain-containing protein [Blastochloris sulfoviridis]